MMYSEYLDFVEKSFEYLDPETNEKYIPFIVESTYGVDRGVLALICNAYTEQLRINIDDIINVVTPDITF